MGGWLGPLSSEPGTYKEVKARFWTWLEEGGPAALLRLQAIRVKCLGFRGCTASGLEFRGCQVSGLEFRGCTFSAGWAKGLGLRS